MTELKRRRREEQFRYFVPSKPPHNDQESAYLSTKKVQFVGGGYRSGKTHLGVNKSIAYCIGVHPTLSKLRPPPIYGRYVGSTWEDGIKGVIIKKFMQCVPRYLLYGGSWQTAWSEKNRSLTFNLDGNLRVRGSVIRFFTGVQHPLTHAGDDIDFCIFDEHQAFPYFQQNMARLIDRDGWLMITMTADAGVTWEDEYVLEKAKEGDPSYQLWQFDSRKNDHLSKEGLAELIKMIGDDRELFRALIMGEMVALSGRIYPMVDEAIHVIDDFDIPKDKQRWHRAVIVDIHTNKPAAIIGMAWDKREGFVYVYREAEWKPSEGGIADLARLIRARFAGQEIQDWMEDDPFGRPEGSDVDPNATNTFGTKSIRDQLRDEGLPFENVSAVSDKDVKAGIMKVRQFLQPDPITGFPRLRFFRSCPKSFRQMQMYRFLEGDQAAKERAYREMIRKVDEDFCDDVRYGIMAEPPMIMAPEAPMRYDGLTGEPLLDMSRIVSPEDYY